MTYRIATLAEVLASPPLIVDGWLVHPDFIRVDGVPEKAYTEPNTGENGLAGHSVVGEEADFLDGVPNRFLSEEMIGGRFTAYAAASCQNILRKRMKHVVMYPVEMATWTSGSRAANCTTWASEAEGGLNPHNEPLTEHQMRGEIVVATAWEQTKKRRLTAADLNEHRHLVARFGGDATACASGRYREVFERVLNGERYIGKGDDMTPEEVEQIVRRVFDQEFPPYYRKVTRQYWDANAPGAFSAPPETEVVDAIKRYAVGELAESFGSHINDGHAAVATGLRDLLEAHERDHVNALPDHQHEVVSKTIGGVNYA